MIKVFRLKDIIKFIIQITIPLVVIFIVLKLMITKITNNEDNKKIGVVITSAFDDNIKLLENSEEENESIKKWGKAIINKEIAIIGQNNNEVLVSNVESEKTEEIIEKENSEPEEEKSEEIKKAEENVKTEVISNGVEPKYNYEYSTVKINNSTDYQLTDEMINISTNEINKKKAIIYHTHTCESYTPTDTYYYEMTGNYRTTDLDFSVSKVGDELAKQLIEYNWNVIHDKSYHDYPSYNGSYSRSLNTAKQLLSDNSDTDIVIDLHRDAIGDPQYAPKVKIGEEYASQLMFVIGTDKVIKEHNNWIENLNFAIAVQEKANELYPGLFKPIILRNSAYNQFVSKAACIIEVGATGNSLDESLCSMKYLAKIFNNI